MKILFIYSIESPLSVKTPLGTPLYTQFGISYISSFLKQSNHDTKLLILSRSFGNQNYNVIRKKIEYFKPKIIGFYSVASQYKFISNISKFIKLNYPEIFLIIGGPHATLKPEEVSHDSFDAICIGEGERPMLELTNMLEKNEFPTNIKNLWIKKDNIIEKNKMAPFYEKLDLLPLPDRTMWKEYIDYNPDLENNVTILLGRGCPFSCTYCCNHAFSKITDGNYVRFRSPRKITEEIQLVHKEYPLENRLYLEVESFNVNNEWAIEVCNEIVKYNRSLETPLSFGLNIRITPNANYDILFESCRRANILDLNIGIESGSERVRKDILKRNYSNFDVINTINSAKKYGLNYNFFIMIGLPGETIKDFNETIKICRIYQPKRIFLSIFYPYPGTDLYKLCEKMNFLQDKIDITIEERMQATLNLPDFNKMQIQRSYIWFNYNVYKGYKSRINLIKEIIEKFLRFNPFTNMILTKYLRSHLIIKLKKCFK
jgi:anaerobic magnesium-protoporphyrin IX monomethyl ester cyclase